ncbi:MAG: hypothetical protein ABWY21_11665, partial [Rhodococcus sp. (in: high G+C Gram-positive bacteria)]
MRTAIGIFRDCATPTARFLNGFGCGFRSSCRCHHWLFDYFGDYLDHFFDYWLVNHRLDDRPDGLRLHSRRLRDRRLRDRRLRDRRRHNHWLHCANSRLTVFAALRALRLLRIAFHRSIFRCHILR